MPNYTRRQGLVLGFHGCDQSVVDDVLSGKTPHLNHSQNTYDWLGNGIYFWEHDPDRAMDWAKKNSNKTNTKITNPAVLGAVIDLGNCLDLLCSDSRDGLLLAYNSLATATAVLPQNSSNRMKRDLDCAVINSACTLFPKKIDSVRGMFDEGVPLYPGAGINDKDHVQICVREPKTCILGYFRPF